jgi:hypothetical protein
MAILATLALGSSAVPAQAYQVVYLETVDWVPTSSVLTVPTSYVAADSYVVPASSVIPTAYTTAYVTETAIVSPTTYLVPSYYETRFQRRGLFGRRLVETTRAYYTPTTAYYMPTTAYYPTTYYYAYPTTYSSRAVVPTEYVVTSSSSVCCGTALAAASTPTVRLLPSEPAPVASRPARSTQPPVIQSRPENEETLDSTVTPLPRRDQQSSVDSSRGAQTGGRAESPPTPPLPSREQSTAAPSRAAPAQSKPAAPASASSSANTQQRPATGQPSSPAKPPGNVEPPTAPADGFDLRPADEGKSVTGPGTVRSESQKPVYSTTRTLRPEFRNILFGSVKARGTGDPEEGVRVTVTSRTNAFEDRVQSTDAAGRFAVRLPDGDWTVKVAMPSGRVYAVSQITVSGGAVADDLGRDIPSLVITR